MKKARLIDATNDYNEKVRLRLRCRKEGRKITCDDLSRNQVKRIHREMNASFGWELWDVKTGNKVD